MLQINHAGLHLFIFNVIVYITGSTSGSFEQDPLHPNHMLGALPLF